MSQTNDRKQIRILSRVDTAQLWTSYNPMLLDKEIGYERDTGKYKIGDGIHTWNELPYASAGLYSDDNLKIGAINTLNSYGANNLMSGASNIAGGKGFKLEKERFNIVSSEGSIFFIMPYSNETADTFSNDVETLKSLVDSGKKIYCSVVVDSAYYHSGTIISVSQAVDGYYFINTDIPNTEKKYNSAQDNPSLYNYYNALIIDGYPELGDMPLGNNAVAVGQNNIVHNVASFAEGKNNIALGKFSHVEGLGNITGHASHAEGTGTSALGDAAHAEGRNTTASALATHAEGDDTKSLSYTAHAEGYLTEAGENNGTGAHAEGINTKAKNSGSHAEGENTVADAIRAHAEGYKSQANGEAAHAEGINTVSNNKGSHSEGEDTKATGARAHAEGYNTEASANSAHAEGINTKALSNGAHAEGNGTKASSEYCHAEGQNTVASGWISHAEGVDSKATSAYAHAEGNGTTASGAMSHAEGQGTIASAASSHAEGNGTQATANQSHAEGNKSLAIGDTSHAEGHSTEARGYVSHTEGIGTISTANYQHVQGMYNYLDSNTKSGNYAHVVGNGTSNTIRSNAHTLDWNGNAWFAGDVYIGGTGQDDPNAIHVKDKIDTLEMILNTKAYKYHATIPSNATDMWISHTDTDGTIYHTWTCDYYSSYADGEWDDSSLPFSNNALFTIDHEYIDGTNFSVFKEAEEQYIKYIIGGITKIIDGKLKITIFGDIPTVEIPIVIKEI